MICYLCKNEIEESGDYWILKDSDGLNYFHEDCAYDWGDFMTGMLCCYCEKEIKDKKYWIFYDDKRDNYYHEECVLEYLTEDCPNYGECGQRYLENYEPLSP